LGEASGSERTYSFPDERIDGLLLGPAVTVVPGVARAFTAAPPRNFDLIGPL
jgi:hypothetical protein